MGYIYCITNIIDNKQYIGKTVSTVVNRWKEHLNDYKRQHCEKRALYEAMKKYGVENFKCETVCECDNELLEDKEKEYIEKYGTFHNGYNLTKGGDGKQLYNYSDIIEFYLTNNVTIVDTAKYFKCHEDTVRQILKNNNIDIRIIKKGHVKKVKEIKCFNIHNEFITKFSSVSDASKWVFEQGKCKTLNSGVRGHICDCANDKTHSAYGFIWKY